MSFLCGFKAFLKKTESDLSPKARKDLYNGNCNNLSVINASLAIPLAISGVVK